MTQRDKVKELVGRGLNSYHTKSLQQIDRIEKKNKEQNHKISILSNELDNDYLTKTEEGSVVSLEHSKEGMIYLDELQGNTLVNYCTDGSKEMTLNGDIDLEGTFVTTTEGVDNGLVDVYCEGNTLVNLVCKNYENILIQGKGAINNYDDTITLKADGAYNKLYFGQKTTTNKQITYKPSTTYTLIINVITNTLKNKMLVGFGNLTTGIFTKTYTTPSDLSSLTNNNLIILEVNPMYHEIDSGEIVASFMLLEGDWTDKEIPPYFEGMKSVGQDDENGHKIEILSQNKNLFNYEEYYKYFPSTKTSDKTILSHKGDLKGGNHNYGFHSPMKVNLKPNATYTLCVFNLSDSGQVLKCEGCLSSKSAELSLTVPVGEIGYKVFTTNSTNYKEGISFKINTSIDGENAKYKIMLVEGDIRPNDYIHYNQDKKEILLNEPLRGLSNGVKDRFVKIGGKLFIERNFHQIILDGSENWQVAVGGETDNIQTYSFLPTLKTKDNYSVRSDKFINRLGFQTNEEGIYGHANGMMFLSINKSKAIDVNTLVQWLSKNNIHVVYQMQTPIYEPLEINPELICYNDTTHISNNSLIPCSMKVQNSGYNAIIKPSTLYTVALDTNKSGTIGMNLGGVKGTTTNNVLTLTTPATLTDDSLRIYGKGIKGSKVRLLEGDKTNWIPSHFEGMKSCFEDKVQEDGTYKMEILSNNKNLFNENILEKANSNYYEIINKDNRRCLKIERPSLMFRTRILNQLKKNTSYKINFDMLYDRTKGDGLAQGASIHIVYTDGTTSTCYASNSYNEWLNANITTPLNKTISYIQFSYGTNTPTYIDLDTFIIQENNNLVDYVYHKSNKIQFSSIEPLRGVGNIKDKFIFKDGKLMIERNCKQITLDGSENWRLFNSSTVKTKAFYLTKYEFCELVKNNSTHICNIYPKETLGNIWGGEFRGSSVSSVGEFLIRVNNNELETQDVDGFKNILKEVNVSVTLILAEPIYEEVPFELQKIILEGYENGTLFLDTNIPPTVTTTYAGETPIVRSVKLNKTEVLNNTTDINDNIIPYLMDMDYRVVCLELATETQGISMARLFGGAYEMLQRDIQSKRYSTEEYRHRLDAYLSVNKITEKEYEELGEMLNE